ncbi:MAG TPA: hypothetical protein VFM68_00925 [Candidatus Saccharimonadales bacterium]|nr:hypothetical protein [Candidatus Saccharimonadales bacterium]
MNPENSSHYNIPKQPAKAPGEVENKQEKKSKLSKKLWAFIAGGAVVVGSATVGANMAKNDSNNENLPPNPDVNAGAPEVPGQPVGETEAPEETVGNNEGHESFIDPETENTSELVEGELVPVENQLFYTEDGKEMTYDELVESVEVPAGEGLLAPEIPKLIFDRFDDMVDHIVSPEEVRHNLNIPDSQEFPTQEQYEQASAAHADAYFDALLDAPEGEMYETLSALRSQAHFDWLVSTGMHEQDPANNPLYNMDIAYLPADLAEGRELNAFVVTDNADKVKEVDEGKRTGVYTFDWSTGEAVEKSDPIDGVYQLKGHMNVERIDPAQQ